MIYVGIDPGKNGGIAWVDTIGIAGALTMPQTVADVWTQIKLLQWPNDPERFSPSKVFVLMEKQHAFPGQGAQSGFTFAVGYGVLLGCLAAAKLPHDLVPPQRWQKVFGLPSLKKAGTITVKKNAHKAVAQRLFPGLKVTHATADALLIAAYCRMTYGEKK